MGEHSGVNMADVVWTTLKKYGIEKRVSLCIPNVNAIIMVVNI
jgi:hypothetical protein